MSLQLCIIMQIKSHWKTKMLCKYANLLLVTVCDCNEQYVSEREEMQSSKDIIETLDMELAFKPAIIISCFYN